MGLSEILYTMTINRQSVLDLPGFLFFHEAYKTILRLRLRVTLPFARKSLQ